jgi:uncharacterized protein (TIGR00369 family)
MKIEDNKFCFACGLENPIGLKLKFIPLEDGSVQAEFRCPSHFQGYAKIVHGGIISTILDEAIVYAGIISLKKLPVTAQIEIRFKRAAMVEEPLLITARIVEQNRRLIKATAEVRSKGDGSLIAEASGKCIITDKVDS